MLCSINDYLLADYTMSGGFALTGLRIRMQRIFDLVIPLGELDPVVMDRNKRRVDISFNVSRIHATIQDAETYITDHDATIPRTGDVKLISQPDSIFSTTITALIVNGALLNHELVRYIGKYTEHAYRISGSPIFAPTPGTDFLVTEAGDKITTETGDGILVE